MPRRAQFCGEFIYHVLNRAAKRARLFESRDDFVTAEILLARARAATAMRLLDYCTMPNHFHLILWPTSGSQLSQFMRRFTGGHAQAWQTMRGTTGSGAVYQGRYKAIPVQSGRHFYNVCRYVQRNPLRAGLVARAEEWPWSSLWRRVHDEGAELLTPWPLPYPANWLATLNAPVPPEELCQIRIAIQRGVPLGDPDWTEIAARAVGLQSRLRPRGRPRKTGSAENCTRPLLSDGEGVG